MEFQEISFAETALRVGLACFFGFVLGYDRAKHDKPLGYRVYMIVCTITCLMAVMALEMNVKLQASDSILFDIGKIVSGIMTGIGFIGAGAIMRQDGDVIGTTTGACIWAAGGLGLLLGFGFYYLALIGFVVITFVLIVLNMILKPIIGKEGIDNHNLNQND